MTKLTETQTNILTAGAMRSDNIAMPLPKGLAGAAAKMSVTKMIEHPEHGTPVIQPLADVAVALSRPRTRKLPRQIVGPVAVGAVECALGLGPGGIGNPAHRAVTVMVDGGPVKGGGVVGGERQADVGQRWDEDWAISRSA